MIQITRPLAQRGREYSTTDRVHPNLVADMDGSPLIDNIDKSKCYLKYEIDKVQYPNDNMYVNLIANGTIEYYEMRRGFSGAVHDETLLYTFLTINHGNGLRTHYAFYLDSYFNVRLRFKDGNSISSNDIGKTITDYFYFGREYNSRFSFLMTIEENGKIINPRQHLTVPNLIPPIVRNYQEDLEEIKPHLKYSWYSNPFSFTKDMNMIGNITNIFMYENHYTKELEGKDLIIRKGFWDSIPSELRSKVLIYWHGGYVESIGDPSTKYFYSISVQLDESINRPGYFNTVQYDFNEGDSRRHGLGVDGSAYPPEMFVDEVISTYSYNYANSAGKDVYLGKFKEGIQSIYETFCDAEYSNGQGQGGAGRLAAINQTSPNVRLWPLSDPPIDPVDPPDPPEPPFVPDNGEKPDDGGGNQNWGQGNGGTDTEGGDFNNDSDEIKDGTGNSFKGGQVFNNYHVLDISEVLQVKNKVWGMTFPGLTRPSEAIISLIAYPFSMQGRIHSSESDVIEIGNSFMKMEDEVWILNAHYNNVLDFGNIKLEPYFGGFQDYAPYTRISIYLPFVGERDLDPTYLQGKTLNLKYYINFTDGSCIAVLSSDGVIYKKFNGIVGQSIPLTQVDNNLLEATISTSLQAAATVAVPGAGMAAVAGVSSASIMNVANSKPSISSSAGRGGETELSLPLQAFLTIERMHCAIAQTFNQEVGRPSMVNKKLSNCKGFTKMLDPQIKTLSTSIENDMINNMLKEGVIINE